LLLSATARPKKSRLCVLAIEALMSVEHFDEQRRQLIAAIRAHTEQVATQIGKTELDKQVLRTMTKVPRHEFVPAEVQPAAYLDRPLPIGFGKTISQPFMVAVMTDLLELKPDDAGHGGARFDPSSPDQSAQGWRKDGDPSRSARRSATCPGPERPERQGRHERNYAGPVFVARGVRATNIPSVLITPIATE